MIGGVRRGFSQRGGYERRWATVRKHLPAVAEAGGWAGPHTLQTIYQRPDEDTMYQVVTGGGQVREAKRS